MHFCADELMMLAMLFPFLGAVVSKLRAWVNIWLGPACCHHNHQASVAPRIAALYAEIETPPGADAATIKRNFRRLMRQHHPDFNGGCPNATERTARIVAAYKELSVQ